MITRNQSIRALGLLILLALVALVCAACNTVKGVGEDVSALGQSMADVASDAK